MDKGLNRRLANAKEIRHRSGCTWKDAGDHGSDRGSAGESTVASTVYSICRAWNGTQKRLRAGARHLRRERWERYWPLSYIDDVNGVRVGGKKKWTRPWREPLGRPI